MMDFNLIKEKLKFDIISERTPKDSNYTNYLKLFGKNDL
jgi:hypothetical protein